MNIKSRSFAGIVTTGVLLIILIAVLPALDELQIRYFCAPTAYLGSVFFGSDFFPVNGGYAFIANDPILITTECSAIRFFALSVAVLAGLAVEKRWTASRILLVPIIAYLLTIFANTSRVISIVYTDSFASQSLPASLLSGVHASAGALTFMSLLALAYYAIWRLDNGEKKKTTVT